MTVIRSQALSLDDATLSGGAAIVAAGSGLPRRITGAIDYEARVLATSPAGYWPHDESAGQFLDRTANAVHLTLGSGVRGVAGHNKGGSTRLGAAPNLRTQKLSSYVGAVSHLDIASGTPWACMTWFRFSSTGAALNAIFVPLGTSASYGSAAGIVVLLAPASGNASIYIGTGAVSYTLGSFPAPVAIGDRAWHSISVRYSGDAFNSLGSWDVRFDGIAVSVFANTSLPASYSTAGTGVYCGYNSNIDGRFFDEGDCIIWRGATVPSAAGLAELSSAIPCGTARWTLPTATYARTLRGFQVPGRLARADLTRLGVKAYYQIGAGARVEFDPGVDPAVSIPADSACYLDVDLTHYHLDDLPYVADSLGGGPIALWEEADPATSISSITTTANGIEIQLSTTVGSIGTITNGVSPALYVTGATAATDTLTVVAHEQAGGGAPTLPDGGWAMGGGAASSGPGPGSPDPWTMNGASSSPAPPGGGGGAPWKMRS